MIMTQGNAQLKAKKEFRKIGQTMSQTTFQSNRTDAVEEILWDPMLRLGHLMMTSFVADQDPGRPGPTLENENRLLKRLDRLYARSHMSMFGV